MRWRCLGLMRPAASNAAAYSSCTKASAASRAAADEAPSGPLKQPVVLRGVGKGRQVERVRQVIAMVEDQALQVHRAGHQDRAAERQAQLEHGQGHAGAARRAIAFAAQVQRRGGAAVAHQPKAHHLGEHSDVAVGGQGFLARRLAGGERPAGVRRVDEHEVEVLQARTAGCPPRWKRAGAHACVVGHHHALRAQRAELQPHRGRAGSAVEGEADAALGSCRRPLPGRPWSAPRPRAHRSCRPPAGRRPRCGRPGCGAPLAGCRCCAPWGAPGALPRGPSSPCQPCRPRWVRSWRGCR